MKKIFYLLFLTSFIVSCSDNVEKKIEQALYSQLEKYPESRLQDIYKNFYQDRFGTGHAISDKESVKKYMEYELENMQYSGSPMIEPLGWEQNFVRINLQMVKDGKISSEDLLEAFIQSAYDLDTAAMNNWPSEWKKITGIIEKNNLRIVNYENDRDSINNLLRIDPQRAMHHSSPFREHYTPHYRVVKKSIFEKIEKK